MYSVARGTEHAWQTTMALGQPITLTGLLAYFGKAKEAHIRVIAQIQA